MKVIWFLEPTLLSIFNDFLRRSLGTIENHFEYTRNSTNFFIMTLYRTTQVVPVIHNFVQLLITAITGLSWLLRLSLMIAFYH